MLIICFVYSRCVSVNLKLLTYSSPYHVSPLVTLIFFFNSVSLFLSFK